MKYDERACKFNMDTGCVELLLRDGRMISIDCTGVEDALDVTMAQRSELNYLIYNDPLGYADLILNGDPEGRSSHTASHRGLPLLLREIGVIGNVHKELFHRHIQLKPHLCRAAIVLQLLADKGLDPLHLIQCGWKNSLNH